MKPAVPVAHRKDYLVREGTLTEAKALVEAFHYARGTANTCVAAHVLVGHATARAVGAALWMPPTRVAALSVSEDWRNVLCLSRFVIAPGEPQNAAGILLAWSIRLLSARWHTLLTYADTRHGHTGTIYRATNWERLGIVGGHSTGSTPGADRSRRRPRRTAPAPRCWRSDTSDCRAPRRSSLFTTAAQRGGVNRDSTQEVPQG